MSSSPVPGRGSGGGRYDSDVALASRGAVASRRPARTGNDASRGGKRDDPLVRELRWRESGQARRGARRAVRGWVVAVGRFLNTNAGYLPLLVYASWVPYVVYRGFVVEGPFSNGVRGIPEWCAWSLSFAMNVWPYFSRFIKTATFVVLVVPVCCVLFVLVRANRVELFALAKAFVKRADKARRDMKPGWVRRRVRRAAREAAAFPATLAESLGQTLVPGGVVHGFVSVVTEEIVSYPLFVFVAAVAGAKKLSRRLLKADLAGVLRDVVWELLEFPTALLAATWPYLQEFGFTLQTLVELFIGPGPLKGHGVPDLKAFVVEDETDEDAEGYEKFTERNGKQSGTASTDAVSFVSAFGFSLSNPFNRFGETTNRYGPLERVEEEPLEADHEAGDASEAERAPRRTPRTESV